MAVQVDVFGSCVSRDLFRYVQYGKYKVHKSFGNIPISTLYDFPVHWEHIEELELSNYNQAMLQMQMNKTLPENLLKDHSNILVIDLADELMKRYYIDDEKKSSLALDDLYENNLIGGDSNISSFYPWDMDLQTIEETYKQFSNKILYGTENPEGYLCSHIIVIESYYAENILGNDGGNLTIKGSTTFNASNVNTGELFYPAMQNVSGGTINIENLTMTGACALYNFAGSGAVNISGGNFQTTTYTIINEANGGKVTLSGGTFTTSGTITIGNDSQTEITGSAILTSSNTSASRIVDNTKTATLTVSGGTIEAKGTTMAIQNINGTINITGGTIKAQNNNAIANQGIANISGTAYVECANYDKAALFNFTGGTTTMTGGTLKNTVSGGYALYKQGGTVTVTGGSAEPKNF